MTDYNPGLTRNRPRRDFSVSTQSEHETQDMSSRQKKTVIYTFAWRLWCPQRTSSCTWRIDVVYVTWCAYWENNRRTSSKPYSLISANLSSDVIRRPAISWDYFSVQLWRSWLMRRRRQQFAFVLVIIQEDFLIPRQIFDWFRNAVLAMLASSTLCYQARRAALAVTANPGVELLAIIAWRRMALVVATAIFLC